MSEPTNVKLDQGAANKRILGRELLGDYRRVEQASLKQITQFKSPEAKRLFARYFHSLQLNVHFISEISRIRLSAEDVEKVEKAIRKSLVALKEELDKAIEGAHLLFQNEGVTCEATYDTKPMELEVGVISSFGRRYLECLQQLDTLMPMLRTLEILEIISPGETDRRRALFKSHVSGPAKSARALAMGLRKRMNDLAKQTAPAIASSPASPPQSPSDEVSAAGTVLAQVAQVAAAQGEQSATAPTDQDETSLAPGDDAPSPALDRSRTPAAESADALGP